MDEPAIRDLAGQLESVLDALAAAHNAMDAIAKQPVDVRVGNRSVNNLLPQEFIAKIQAILVEAQQAAIDDGYAALRQINADFAKAVA